MDIKLPLDRQSFLNQFAKKELVLARNVPPATQITPVGTIVFSSDGAFSGDKSGRLEVGSGGQLMLTDQYGKVEYGIAGAETRNWSTYLVGEPYREASLAGFARCILYERKPLKNFRICISSHKDYMADTMPRLSRSIARAGFPRDRIIIIVGGVGKNDQAETEAEGCKVVFIEDNFNGLTALSALPEDGHEGRWLLLHDTCELMDDFQDRMAKLDVGLNFDRIVAHEDIGLYSSTFIHRAVKSGVLNDRLPLIALWHHCFLWMELSPSRHVSTKDVYGTGTSRDVLYLDSIGVKKYRRARGAVAKP
jgi:hypothetical protein